MSKPSILEVVQAADRFWRTGVLPGDQPEMARFDYKTLDSVAERAVMQGYLEYGVSVRTAWLEPKGRALLSSHQSITPPANADSARRS